MAASKLCRKCGEIKSEADFLRRKDTGYLTAHCRPCRAAKNREYRRTSETYLSGSKKRADLARAWRMRNLAHVREYGRKRLLRFTYGIEPEEYDALLRQQGGVCAICKEPESKGPNLHVDHCHETGRVRGLLCAACNLGLGKLGDTVEAIAKALAYLKSA